jgi:hypothetical protein
MPRSEAKLLGRSSTSRKFGLACPLAKPGSLDFPAGTGLAALHPGSTTAGRRQRRDRMSLVRRIAPNQQAIPAVEYLMSDA